jgi:hypothetical protein
MYVAFPANKRHEMNPMIIDIHYCFVQIFGGIVNYFPDRVT